MAALSALLVEKAYTLRCAALPGSVREQVKLLILDACAGMLAGSRASGAVEIRQAVAEWGGLPQATVFPSGLRAPSMNAAFANSVALHSLDYDEGLGPGSLHAMTSLLPAVLALGEARPECSGERLVESVAIGLETAGRLAVAGRQGGLHEGWVPATLFGGIGASIAGSYMLGIDPDRAVDAVGMTFAQNAGSRQALIDGSLTKRLQPGFAARSAVLAVDLAQRGLTGPAGALDGRYGLFPMVVGSDAPVDSILSGWGELFLIEDFRIKAFPGCLANHQPIAAALDFRSELDLAGIDSIEVRLPHVGYQLVGAPFTIRGNPQVDAQFSAAYTVAHALIHGEVGIEAFEPEHVTSDQTVLDLARRIHCVELPAGKRGPIELDVTLKDGSHRLRQRSEPVAITSFDGIRRKLDDCANYAGFPRDKTDRLCEVCLALDQGAHLADLVATLTE